MAEYAAASAAANLCVKNSLVRMWSTLEIRGVKEKNRYMYRYICVREQYLGNTGWDLKN
jgi:hypothetical protein